MKNGGLRVWVCKQIAILCMGFNEIKLFEDKKIWSVWDGEKEKWLISIIDVIAILTESIDTNACWRKLK